MDTVARVLFCFQINQHLVLFEIWMISHCPGTWLPSEPSHPPASVSLALGSHVCNDTDTEPQRREGDLPHATVSGMEHLS